MIHAVNRSRSSFIRHLSLSILLGLFLGIVLPTASVAQYSRSSGGKRPGVSKKSGIKGSSAKKRPAYYVNQDGDTVVAPFDGRVVSNTGGGTTIQTFGTAGDKPVPSAFVP